MDAGLLEFNTIVILATLGFQVEFCSSRVGGEIDGLLEFEHVLVLMLIEINDDHLRAHLSNQLHLHSFTFFTIPFEFHMDIHIVGLSYWNLLIVRRVKERDGDMPMVMIVGIITGREGEQSESEYR